MHFSTRLFHSAITPEQKQERRDLLTSHALMIKFIQEVVDEEIKAEQSAHIAAGYSDAAWAYRQADVNGAIRALTKVRDFLTIKD